MRFWMVLWMGCQSPVGQFECGGKALQTVANAAVCDGVIDCWGGQDERADSCATEVFYCTESVESEAILVAQVCDGVNDCADTSDASDEADCPG